eukprot:Nk52_evm1s2139 gene=Nk52_evmTU1s2139
MALVREYRLPLPFTVSEFHIGQRYMASKYSRVTTSPGDGFQNIQNIQLDNHPVYARCTFTEKRLYFGNRIPKWAHYLIPTKAFYVRECSYNFYPHTVTEYTCSFLPIYAKVETIYVDNDYGANEEVCKNQWEKEYPHHKRTVRFLDIASHELHKDDDPYQQKSHKKNNHLKDTKDKEEEEEEEGKQEVREKNQSKLFPARVFRPQKFPQRGPLFKGWAEAFWRKTSSSCREKTNSYFVSSDRDRSSLSTDETTRPVMCVYKLISISFHHMYGLRSHVQRYILDRNETLMLDAHLQSFLWMDEWYGMGMEEVREYEEETKGILNSSIVVVSPQGEETEETKKEVAIKGGREIEEDGVIRCNSSAG